MIAKNDVTISTDQILPNGLETTLNDDSESFYNVSNKKVDEFFNINFLISDSTQIPAHSKIIV